MIFSRVAASVRPDLLPGVSVVAPRTLRAVGASLARMAASLIRSITVDPRAAVVPGLLPALACSWASSMLSLAATPPPPFAQFSHINIPPTFATHLKGGNAL